MFPARSSSAFSRHASVRKLDEYFTQESHAERRDLISAPRIPLAARPLYWERELDFWQLRPGGKVWGAGIKMPANIRDNIPASIEQDWGELWKYLTGEKKLAKKPPVGAPHSPYSPPKPLETQAQRKI